MHRIMFVVDPPKGVVHRAGRTTDQGVALQKIGIVKDALTDEIGKDLPPDQIQEVILLRKELK